MCNYDAETWKCWYEAQQREMDYTRRVFSHEKPTLKPFSSFDPSDDAEVLRKAMKGLGTNEDDIIKILSTRTLDQRCQIQEQYQQIHGRDLIKDLESELTGIFEKVILSLLKPIPLFLADQIKHATKGAGTDENTIIEIFCTRDDESITSIKEAFEKEYELSLEEVICKETTGSFEKILMSILALCRDDSASSPSDVADELVNEDIDEDNIRRIMTSYSFDFLKSAFNEYSEKTGEDFLQLIEKKCSGDSQKAFAAIYNCAKSRAQYLAIALNDAMEGCGTDDWALIRIIVTRCEIDLETVKDKYQELYEKDIIEQIKSEISGEYENTLLNLLGYVSE